MRLQDEDIWDMPNSLGICGNSGAGHGHFDLPEFFRDSLAPPFRADVLEGAHLPPCALGGGRPHPSEDDDDDDEILLGRQLLD